MRTILQKWTLVLAGTAFLALPLASSAQLSTYDIDARLKSSSAQHKRPLLQSCPHVYPSLEIKVKAEQQLARVHVGAGQAKSWAGTILMQPVVLVVPGKASPRRHERVVAVTDGVRRDIAEVGRGAGGRLLRHPDGFIPRDEDELQAVDVVRLNKYAVPTRGARPWSQRCQRACGVVIASRAVDQVTVPLPEPHAIPAMLRDHLKIKMLSEVELADEAFAMEGFVADSRARHHCSAVALREIGRAHV